MRGSSSTELLSQAGIRVPIANHGKGGVDTQCGLARVGGNVTVYRKILQQFAKPLQQIVERIDGFEFDEALGLLNALRQMMRSSATESDTLT